MSGSGVRVVGSRRVKVSGVDYEGEGDGVLIEDSHDVVVDTVLYRTGLHELGVTDEQIEAIIAKTKELGGRSHVKQAVQAVLPGVEFAAHLSAIGALVMAFFK